MSGIEGDARKACHDHYTEEDQKASQRSIEKNTLNNMCRSLWKFLSQSPERFCWDDGESRVFGRASHSPVMNLRLDSGHSPRRRPALVRCRKLWCLGVLKWCMRPGSGRRRGRLARMDGRSRRRDGCRPRARLLRHQIKIQLRNVRIGASRAIPRARRLSGRRIRAHAEVGVDVSPVLPADFDVLREQAKNGK